MTIVRRTRVTARPSVNAARRTRVAQATRDYYSEVIALLKSVAELDAEQESLKRRTLETEQAIEALMTEGKLEKVDDGVFQAKRAETVTRSTRVIDLKALRKKVGDATFLKMCSVTIATAKDFLSEKELALVSEVQEGSGTGEYKTTVSRVKKK